MNINEISCLFTTAVSEMNALKKENDKLKEEVKSLRDRTK